jgi:hypothetical protein
MAACRKPWSGHVKFAGFSGFAPRSAPEFQQHIGQICASREPQCDDRVECYVEKTCGGMEMQCAALVQRYRSYAARCLKISRNISDPAGKLMLLEMAQSWLKLAEEAVERAETVVVYEAAVANAPQSD